jgi:hypothetical protein
MATNGVNGANGAPKTAADFKPEEFQNAKQEKIRNTIFELDEAIANDVEAMEADGEITSTVDKATGKSEVDRIYDWVSVIDNMIGNMSDKVKASLQDSVQILKDWVADLIDMAGMGQYRGENITYEDGGEVVINAKQAPKAGMAATSLEPTTTDSQTVQSSENRVPNRMYWKADQADMEEVYVALTNPVGRNAGLYKKPQAQIGALMGFIGLYSKRLDKGQIAFLRQSIQNLNELAKQQREEELASLPASVRANLAGKNPLPDADKVKAYWNAVKTAGFSHDLKAELTVLGYSKKDAERISSQI